MTALFQMAPLYKSGNAGQHLNSNKNLTFWNVESASIL